MAIYSALMMAQCSASVIQMQPSTYKLYNALIYQADALGRDAYIDYAGDNFLLEGYTSQSMTRLVREHETTTFDPTVDTISDDFDALFTVVDDRLLLNLAGCFTVSVLNTSYESDNQAYYVMMLSTNTAYPMIKVNLALLDELDEDLPENWRLSKRPDVKLVYNKLAAGKDLVVRHFTLDITDLVCDVPSHHLTAKEWRSTFAPSTHTFVGA